MPDQPELPPVPDALRRDRPAPAKPPVNIFNDPFNPDPAPVPPKERGVPAADGEDGEKNDEPASGLTEFDAPHAFASVLTSGLGRVAVIILTCMLSFGFTAACYRVSLLGEGWALGGFGGFFRALVAVPGSLFTGPGEWFHSLGIGITDPVGVPYLLLFVGGIILAVRSEIHIVNLIIFYAMLSALHAAAFLKMKNPVSVILWLGVLAGYVWLYRWYWRQQMQVEEEPPPEEE